MLWFLSCADQWPKVLNEEFLIAMPQPESEASVSTSTVGEGVSMARPFHLSSSPSHQPSSVFASPDKCTCASQLSFSLLSDCCRSLNSARNFSLAGKTASAVALNNPIAEANFRADKF